MTSPTVTIEYELVEGGGVYVNNFSSDALPNITVKYGLPQYNPAYSHIANVGNMTFFLDNSSSDFPYTEASSDGNVRGKGVGTRYRIKVTHDTDRILFNGRVTEWNPLPGLVASRTTEVICEDYIGELSRYPIKSVNVQTNKDAKDLLLNIVNSAPFGVMPYRPVGFSYSSNGDVFTIAFYDLYEGSTKCINAFSKVARSELGHVYTEAGRLYYKNQDEWISLGRESIGTLDNQFQSLAIGKNRNMEFAPIYVTFNPSEISDSEEIIYSHGVDFDLQPGQTQELFCRYNDPENPSVQISCISSDVTTPVLNTDYIYTFASTDDVDSDMDVSFSNLSATGKYTLTNNGASIATYTTLQIRGKPIRSYDKVKIASPDGNPTAVSMTNDLTYADNYTFAKQVNDFLSRVYSRYIPDSYATSISFVATADSDTMQLAMLGEVGKSFRLVEDVNVVDAHYRIMSVQWDFTTPSDIVVTWDIYPEDYTALEMVDENNVYLTDSNQNILSFWR